MRYTVTGVVTVSCHTTVEADSPAEAAELASERKMCALGFYSHTAWNVGRLDGEAEVLEVHET